MKLGFIIPTYPSEKRVALLPEHIYEFENKLYIEEGFGKTLDIEDFEYVNKGCVVVPREEVFNECDAIFCLKLLQPEDYEFLREGQMIIGWTHPTGSGKDFMITQASLKKLKIVDLDNIYPAVYYLSDKYDITHIPRNFIKRNSFLAGFSSTMHALMSYGKMPTSNTKVAILSSGNVSQGAFVAISKFNTQIQLFYRKTLNEFYQTISDYDIIINGIEVDEPGTHILSKDDLSRLKINTLIIDSAADAGNAIEGTHYTKLTDPIYKENGLYYYVVNNAPTIYFRESSYAISESFSKYVYKYDVSVFNELIK